MHYDELFKEENIKEYRAIPFWSWNDELETEKLREQIRWMKRQGFGRYFMHARGALTTEYLGEKWFDCINACLDEGEGILEEHCGRKYGGHRVGNILACGLGVRAVEGLEH